MHKGWNSVSLVSCTVFIVFDSGLSCGFKGNTVRLCFINESENTVVAKHTVSWRYFWG